MRRTSWKNFITACAALVACTWMAGCAAAPQGTAAGGYPATLSQLGPGAHELALPFDNLPRRYTIYLPKNYRAGNKWPAVIMFHGGGGTAKAAMKETSLTETANREGFLAVFPEGNAPDPSKPGRFRDNPQTWNDGSGRFFAGEKNIDDVGFTHALLDDLISRFNTDPQRIYVTGFSNGASMAYRLGAELAPRVAAIAPVASSGLKVADPRILRPVPMVTIQGDADPRNPLAGGDVDIFGTIQRRPPPGESVAKWAQLNGCSPKAQTIVDRNGVKAVRYGECHENAEVIYYIVEGMGHTWPGGIALLPEDLVGKTTDKLKANEVLWDFFKRQRLPDQIR